MTYETERITRHSSIILLIYKKEEAFYRLPSDSQTQTYGQIVTLGSLDFQKSEEAEVIKWEKIIATLNKKESQK